MKKAAGLFFALFLIFCGQARISAKSPPLPRIIIVHATDEDEKRFGQYPWPRSVHSDIIVELERAHAKTIVLKYMFDEHSEHSLDAQADQKFLDVLGSYKNIILPFSGWAASGIPLSETAQKLVSRFAVKNGAKETQFLSFKNAAFPTEDLLEKSGGVGCADMDSFHRRVSRMPLLVKVGEKLYPSLSLMAAIDVLGLAGSDVVALDGELILGTAKIRMDEEGMFRPAFTVPGEKFKTYSYTEIMRGRFRKDFVQDSIVVVGYAGSRFPSDFVSPVSKNHNGADLNADAISTILLRAAPNP